MCPLPKEARQWLYNEFYNFNEISDELISIDEYFEPKKKNLEDSIDCFEKIMKICLDYNKDIQNQCKEDENSVKELLKLAIEKHNPDIKKFLEKFRKENLDIYRIPVEQIIKVPKSIIDDPNWGAASLAHFITNLDHETNNKIEEKPVEENLPETSKTLEIQQPKAAKIETSAPKYPKFERFLNRDVGKVFLEAYIFNDPLQLSEFLNAIAQGTKKTSLAENNEKFFTLLNDKRTIQTLTDSSRQKQNDLVHCLWELQSNSFYETIIKSYLSKIGDTIEQPVESHNAKLTIDYIKSTDELGELINILAHLKKPRLISNIINSLSYKSNSSPLSFDAETIAKVFNNVDTDVMKECESIFTLRLFHLSVDKSVDKLVDFLDNLADSKYDKLMTIDTFIENISGIINNPKQLKQVLRNITTNKTSPLIKSGLLGVFGLKTFGKALELLRNEDFTGTCRYKQLMEKINLKNFPPQQIGQFLNELDISQYQLIINSELFKKLTTAEIGKALYELDANKYLHLLTTKKNPEDPNDTGLWNSINESMQKEILENFQIKTRNQNKCFNYGINKKYESFLNATNIITRRRQEIQEIEDLQKKNEPCAKRADNKSQQQQAKPEPQQPEFDNFWSSDFLNAKKGNKNKPNILSCCSFTGFTLFNFKNSSQKSASADDNVFDFKTAHSR